MRQIIEANELVRTFAAMVCDELLREEWRPWWDEFAKLDRVDFLERAYWLRKGLSAFRSAIEEDPAPNPVPA